MINKLLKYGFNISRTSFFSFSDWKSYAFLTTISLIFLFHNIWEIKPVKVEISDFVGLLSHFTVSYWIGFIIIVFCSIRLYLDTKYKNILLYIYILFVLGLYLFGVPIFAEENARFPWSYYPAGQVKTVLETKYIDPFSPNYELLSYNSWPATHIISSTIMYLADIKIENLLKYMPLFWLFSLILITITMGRHLNLMPDQSFMVSFLILSSFWSFHYYYGPQSIGYIFYLLFSLFIVRIIIQKSIRNSFLLITTFIGMVMTHMLSSIFSLSSFVLSSSFIRSIHEKRLKFILFFSVFLIAWHMYLAPLVFQFGTKEFIEQITNLDFGGYFISEKYAAGKILTRQITHYSRLFYLGIFGTAIIVAAALYLTGRINKKDKELIKIFYYWLIGISALFLFRYGETEMEDRIYIFSLIPMIFILILTFKKQIITIFAILFIALHLPAHYGMESSDMLYSSELSGDKFFVDKANFVYKDTIIYEPSPVLKFFRNGIDIHLYPYEMIAKPEFNLLKLNDIKYIIFTKQFNNFMIYNYDINLYNLDLGYSNLVYANGNYNIYFAGFQKVEE